MNALAQTVVNGYEFYERVGAGGFGIVYRALQPALGREVAIKVILPEHASQPEFTWRFEQEARLIARLEHPHIVPLYDYWQDASGAYLVMRWLPETVRQRVQQAPFSLSAAATLLDQVAGALHVAHRSRVIHRDIKPDNLLLDHQGNTYLADFGIAKVLGAGVSTTSRQLVGSIAYLAPEQINDLELTPQVDIYSLGLVMYEILTGVRPYAGSSASALLQHHLNDPLPSLRTHRPDLPSALDAVLATATAKKPADRYEDAIRFARAFRAVLPTPRHFQPLADPLTERELEILRLLATGLSSGEIAERLYVSLSTIKWYKKQIYSKLDVHSREMAVDQARALGLIRADDGALTQATGDIPLDRTIGSALISNPTPPTPARVPTPTTPLIGREAEIAALMSLLRDPATRLISVLAPGGMGKTRLALEVASGVAGEFRDGAAFVALGAVSEPEQVVSAVASAVGVTLSGQLDPKQQLLEHFRPWHSLLVLDNFEQLLDAAPLLTEILETAPQVKLLTTTRERLNLRVETVFPLAGLDTPGAHLSEDLLSFGSVRLFVSAARRTSLAAEYSSQDLMQIGHICRLVQGMPLAILLAASWTDLLKVGEIADEVNKGIDFLESQWRDLPERQRSIRAVFDASWRRLTSTEAEVLAKLSVFRGGFTRRAAEQVAVASLRTLSALVNKALLWMDTDGRCSIHELLRQYAAQQLEAAGSGNSVCAAHSAYYLEALVARESDLIGHNQLVTLNDIEADIENVRAAVTWATTQRDYARLAAAVHPLWLYFYYGGAYADGGALFEALAAALRHDPPMVARDTLLGDVLTHQSHLLHSMSEPIRADQCLAEADPLVEASGDVRSRAFYHWVRAYWHTWDMSDRTAQAQAARVALKLYQSIGDRWGEAWSYQRLVTSRLFAIDAPDEETEQAASCAIAITKASGDACAYARALTNSVLLHHTDLATLPARITSLEQVLALERLQKNPIATAIALNTLGVHLAWSGRLEEAVPFMEEGIAIRRQQGVLHDTYGFDGLSYVNFRLGRLAEARSLSEEAFRYVRDSDFHIARNLHRLTLMLIDCAEGDYAEAEARASGIAFEMTATDAAEHQFLSALIFALAGLAALRQGASERARDWCDRATRAADADPDRNSVMFTEVIMGLIMLTEGFSEQALSLLDTALDDFRTRYHWGNILIWDREIAPALALTGCSRAAVRLDQIERARAYCGDALKHAQRLNVDAFALMALIPAAEIALAQGDTAQTALLAALVARHPHTFAYDRTEAMILLAQLPEEIRSPQQVPDLWTEVSDLTEA
jgi:serine/threonine protein kinase/predicted ATPase